MAHLEGRFLEGRRQVKNHRLNILALIVIVSTLLAVVAERFGGVTGVQVLELNTLEFRQRATGESRRPGSPRESDIVLVFFDSASVSDWPWEQPFPRSVLADVISALSQAGAKAIGLDVYLQRLYPELNAIDGGDDRLHEAIAAAGNVVLAAPTAVTPSGPQLSHPDPYFADVAVDVAAADLPTPFETVYDGALAVRSGDGLEPSLALALYARVRGLDVDSLLNAAWTSGSLDLPFLPPSLARLPAGWRDGTAVADDYVYSFPIRFDGPPSHMAAWGEEDLGATFVSYSSSVVPLVAPFTPEAFRDKLVLIGTGFHDSDKFRTAFSSVRPVRDSTALTSEEAAYQWTYGVEIHANALQNMLDGEYVRPLAPIWVLLMVLAATLVSGGIAFWKGAAWGGIATVLTGLAVLCAAFWAWSGEVFLPGTTLMTLDQRFLEVPVVTPLLAALMSYVGSVAYVSVVEGKDKRFIKSAFGKYVSPEVVEQISQNPGALQLGGQKRPLTILFSDLAGFTDLSETLDPQDLIAKLNEYLTEMTRLVLDEEGTLDKYIGDAIMAFWNAPMNVPDHADRALRCAIVMQRRMRNLNKEWLARDPSARPLTVRIGINTGEVVVGNVGGKEKFDYSAIGDGVNLAARLEPANKTYHTLTMASEYTVAAASEGAFRFRELDRIAVKGKVRPVTVYEVLEEVPVQLHPRKEEVIRHYEAGLKAYKHRDWELALRYFQAALATDPEDGPSQLYVARSFEYMENPPPAEWDFVVRRTVK